MLIIVTDTDIQCSSHKDQGSVRSGYNMIAEGEHVDRLLKMDANSQR